MNTVNAPDGINGIIMPAEDLTLNTCKELVFTVTSGNY